MRKKTKIFLSMGAAIAAAVPIAAVLSCGSQNNSQKDKGQNFVPNSNPAKPTVVTSQFFADVQNYVQFAGNQGQVYLVPNKALDAGLANATVKYGWTKEGDTDPKGYVTDYQQLNDMEDGYIFWIVVTPNAGFDMGSNQSTTLKINVQSDGYPTSDWSSNTTPSDTVVVTADFFNNVKNTITFTGTGRDISPVDNTILNAGVANAKLMFAWSSDGSVPQGEGLWVPDYHTLTNMGEDYTFFVGVVPNDGFRMGVDQETRLAIVVHVA